MLVVFVFVEVAAIVVVSYLDQMVVVVVVAVVGNTIVAVIVPGSMVPFPSVSLSPSLPSISLRKERTVDVFHRYGDFVDVSSSEERISEELSPCSGCFFSWSSWWSLWWSSFASRATRRLVCSFA